MIYTLSNRSTIYRGGPWRVAGLQIKVFLKVYFLIKYYALYIYYVFGCYFLVFIFYLLAWPACLLLTYPLLELYFHAFSSRKFQEENTITNQELFLN